MPSVVPRWSGFVSMASACDTDSDASWTAAATGAAAAERRDEWQRQASAALAGLEDGVRALEADMLALRLDLRLGLQGVGAEGVSVGFSRAGPA